MSGPVKLRRRRRTYNLKRIRATWPYTVQDIAALLGVHKNAVGRWLREGLQADRQQRPFLIRGDELARFLLDRHQRRRTKCNPTQFFCFKCRAARDPAGGRADLRSLATGRFMLRARCGHCGTRMNKVLGTKKLLQIQSRLCVSEQRGEHIIKCGDPNVNSALETQL